MRPFLLVLALLPRLAFAVANANGTGLPAHATDNATAADTFASSTFSITDTASEVYACFCQNGNITNLATNPLSCTGGGGASGLTFSTIAGHLTALGQDAPSPNFTGAVACARATASSAITNGTVTCRFASVGPYIARSVVVFAKTAASATIGAHDGVDNENTGIANAISLTTTGSSGSVAVAMGCGGPSAVTAPTYLAGSTAITAWGNVTAGNPGDNYTNWIVESTGLSAGSHTLGTSAPNTAGVMVAFEIQDAAGPTQAATPTANPGAGTYSSTQSVTLSTTSSGAIICYTTNGTTPATNGTTGCTTGTLYSTAVSIASTSTLRAIAGGTGYTDSGVLAAAYTITTAAATPVISPSSTTTLPQTVSITCSTGSSTICYTTTGATPADNGSSCTTGTAYTGTFVVSTTTTVNAECFASGYSSSSVATATYGSGSGGSGWWSRLYRRFLPERVLALAGR